VSNAIHNMIMQHVLKGNRIILTVLSHKYKVYDRSPHVFMSYQPYERTQLDKDILRTYWENHSVCFTAIHTAATYKNKIFT